MRLFSSIAVAVLASPAAASLPSFFDVFTDMSYSTDTIVQRQDYGFTGYYTTDTIIQRLTDPVTVTTVTSGGGTTGYQISSFFDVFTNAIPPLVLSNSTSACGRG